MATTKKAAAENYSADDIKHLSPRDALRKKTAMYIGSTDAHGLFTCVREVADNILDEALAGYCTAGTIVAKSGTEFWMHDNGRGMPTGMMEIEDPVSGTKSKIPALQAITSLLHAGGKIDATNSAYKASRGCFTGNTKVRLLNGKVIKLSKLHRAWEAGKFSGGLDILIFDRRTKKLVPSKISDVILSKYVDVLTRVHTTSGGYVDCTPDHKFYINSGEVIKGVRADKLVPGTSLVTSYVSYDRDGYLKATEQGTVRRVHRVVAEKTYGQVKKYAHVHHADGTRTNNVPNNLEVLSPAQPQKEHIEQIAEQGRAIMASEQAEALRRRNSMYMQELAATGRLIKQQRQTICLNIAARAMYAANTEVLTRAVYNADRLDNDPHWKTALKWFNSESEFVNRAHARLLELKAKQFRSLRAYETLTGERTTGTAGISKIGSDAARINNFLRILDCAGGMQATPEAFNVRVGDTVFGSYAKLCAFTSLKNLKELYSGKTNILKRFSEESFDDVTARMIKAELAVSSAQVRYNRALGFLARASRAGAPACTVEAIDLIIAKENPKNPTASRQTLHLGLSCAKKEFGKSLSKHYINFNTKVVRVETINLRTPVPVFDLTIDHPSHNFFVQLDGTQESDKETHVLVSNSHAVGQKATNFLSEYFKVTTFSASTKGAEKQWHAIEYLDGKLSSPMKKCKPPVNPLTKEAVKKGTVVEFKLNTSFFTDKSFSPSLLVEYLKIASYFTPGFKWTLSSASGKSKVFHSERGVLDYMDDYKESLKEVSSLKEGNILQASSGLFDVALDFTNADGSHLKGFTNGLLNSEGGTHVNATLQALLKSVTPFAKKNQVFSSTELREGLVGLINVKLSAPRFTSQVKVRLDDERADAPLRDSLIEEFTKFFKKNKSLAELICERCTKLKELKSKFLASKAVVTAINKTKAKGFPAKALAAPNCKPEQRELYIVEGDSAKGPVTAERDAFYQEALPIRGKIMNAHRATPAKFFSSDEVIDLLAMIGFDPKSPDPLGKLRVNKLIFLTDADSDGPLVGSTRILMCDGTRPTIESLAKKGLDKFYVWSVDKNGLLVPALARMPTHVKTVTELYRITLDDGTVIKCEDSHSWFRTGHPRKRVKTPDLKVGDSLHTTYFRESGIRRLDQSPKYKQWYDPRTNRWSFVHQRVQEHLDPVKFAEYRTLNQGVTGGRLHIHHANGNSLDNTPYNLEYISKEAHFGLHGREFALAYNGSDKHLMDLHQYRCNNTAYVEAFASRALAYNKSEDNRESTRKLNRRSDVKRLQLLGKLARVYSSLIHAGIPTNEPLNWFRYKLATNSSSYTLLAAYGNGITPKVLREYIESNGGIQAYASTIMRVPEEQALRAFMAVRNRFLSICKSLRNNGRAVNEANYIEYVAGLVRGGNAPAWEAGLELIGGIGNLTESIDTYNHTIVSIKKVKTKPTKVYCMAVPSTGSFMIADKEGNGVLTGNCHISVLLLSMIHKYLPDLIDRGMVYVADIPEYMAEVKGKPVYGDSKIELQEKLQKLGAPKATIHHFKGLGEMESPMLKAMALDPQTRRLRKVTRSTADNADSQFVATVSGDASTRRTLLGI